MRRPPSNTSWKLTAEEESMIALQPVDGGIGARARAFGVSIRTLDRVVVWGEGSRATHEKLRRRLRALSGGRR